MQEFQWVALTGSSEVELERVWSKVKQDGLFPWFALCICIAKLNLTNDAAAALSPLFVGTLVSEREVRRRLDEVAAAAQEASLLDRSIRFLPSQQDGLFPQCTGIVDVTTIACRSKGEKVGSVDGTWSGKHRDHVYKLETWCTLQGVPFWVSKAHQGRPHDMSILHETKKFAHYTGEYFLGDLGYIGANHVVTEFKKGEDSGTVVTDAIFGEWMRVVRSRIERTFAWMDVYHLYHGTDRLEESVNKLVYLTFAVQQHKMLHASPRYDVELPPQPFTIGQRCGCLWQKSTELVNDAKAHRQKILAKLEDSGVGWVVETKKPAKRRRDEEIVDR